MRSRKDAKCAKSVVAKVILPGCVHPRMIAVKWNNFSDADSDLFGLVWGDEP